MPSTREGKGGKMQAGWALIRMPICSKQYGCLLVHQLCNSHYSHRRDSSEGSPVEYPCAALSWCRYSVTWPRTNKQGQKRAERETARQPAQIGRQGSQRRQVMVRLAQSEPACSAVFRQVTFASAMHKSHVFVHVERAYVRLRRAELWAGRLHSIFCGSHQPSIPSPADQQAIASSRHEHSDF